MSESRRPSLRAGIAAACLLIAAGACVSQTVPTTPEGAGGDCRTDAGKLRPVREARGRSALADDFAAIAQLRDPRGLASYLSRAPATCDEAASSRRRAGRNWSLIAYSGVQ